jgi:hypothetical protein
MLFSSAAHRIGDDHAPPPLRPTTAGFSVVTCSSAVITRHREVDELGWGGGN